ncbi:TrAP [Vernonia crinkle virus]|uniref:Transcriptional activator protein n=1 Tax=Vernonia crinkle virus TaxID=1925153 RepID=A0A1L4AB02_9GEMI|nr:TrAP [Vernonia crinkle virus]API65469.1 TrAP [Vernonia crinkle virus]
MRCSTPSPNHSSPPNIKAQHREKKRRSIRRKKIDLPCGCAYLIHLNCRNHGFTHRGTHYCNSGNEWRVYLEPPQPSVLHHTGTPQTTVHNEQRRDTPANQIQPQPAESSRSSQVFYQLEDLDWFTASDIAFLESVQDTDHEVHQPSRNSHN